MQTPVMHLDILLNGMVVNTTPHKVVVGAYHTTLVVVFGGVSTTTTVDGKKVTIRA